MLATGASEIIESALCHKFAGPCDDLLAIDNFTSYFGNC